MVKVIYNEQDVFNGLPTPFVAINNEMVNYGKRWAIIQVITLTGMIIGECEDAFNSIITKQNSIILAFAQDFKQIKITDESNDPDNTDILGEQFKYAKVKNIDFAQSAYSRNVEYTIVLEAYPEILFKGTFGVTDPVSQIKYTENQDGTVNITRNFSAKGFNTSSTLSSNALDNARGYIATLTGTAPIFPKFINGIGHDQQVLQKLSPRKITESINRMESTYSVDIDYLLKKDAQTNTVLTYTADATYDNEAGLYTVDLKGSLSAGESKDIVALRDEFGTNARPFEWAMQEGKKCFSSIPEDATPFSLNPSPQSINITENETNGSIDFTYSYTSDPENVKFDYSVGIQNEYFSDRSTVDFNATFTAKGDQKTRLQKAQQAFAATNVAGICSKYYADSNLSLAPLNTNYRSFNVSSDISQGTLTVNASLDNSPIPPSDFVSWSWSLDVAPSLNRYSPIQFLNGNNGYFDLNYYIRGKVTLKGSLVATGSQDLTEKVKELSLQIYNQNSPTNLKNEFLEQHKVDRSLKKEDNGYVYNFVVEKSCETEIFDI